jgi:hypothetical protein
MCLERRNLQVNEFIFDHLQIKENSLIVILLRSACIINVSKFVCYGELGMCVGYGDSKYAQRFCIESSCTPTVKRICDGYIYRIWGNKFLNCFREKTYFIHKVKFRCYDLLRILLVRIDRKYIRRFGTETSCIQIEQL